ncbi:MAG TPA: class I SAM-dependent methyltransferase [Myxococcaceae bacterium]
MTPPDPFLQFKAAQRESWSLFIPMETGTTTPAFDLVRFAAVAPGERVLDVACGTGVVAITAARMGAAAEGLDLTPALLDRARQNAALAGFSIGFREGDAEALPYPDASFDVVLSQFGHMFAPRPEVAVSEMLRVLRPGGRLAFSTWPPDEYVGRIFSLAGRQLPSPPPGAPAPAPPPQWGDPDVVRQRLGDRVTDLSFARGEMVVPALSPEHVRQVMETTIGPLIRLMESLRSSPEKLEKLRSELLAVGREYWHENRMRQAFLMSRAKKRI